MNAKKLRQAAERTMDYDESDDTDIDEIARHILATVREDDDEPVTEERVRRCGFSRNAEGILELKYDYDTWLQFTEGCRVWIDRGDGSVCVGVVNNMGQFRSLCRGLGIELDGPPERDRFVKGGE